MKMAELLRQMADKLDTIDSPNQITVAPDETEDQPKMMAPNQQKMELLKKSVGVESEYDDEDSNDEISDIKRMAGVNTAAIHIAADNDPVEG